MSAPLPTLTELHFPDLARRLGSETRARVALKWVYADADLAAALPPSLPGVAHRAWSQLRQAVRPLRWEELDRRSSPDGTVKLALRFEGADVETVLIPGPHRSTVCISSQAGCTRKCVFCATASLGFTRNLSPGEITAQYLLAQRLAPPGKPARNVVFMGMGEPMDNLDAVLESVRLLTQRPVPCVSAKHITISTAGVVPGMKRFLKESEACLALSLNATTDEQRQRLMPHNQLWPIAEVLSTVRQFGGERDVFIEYVLFNRENDTDDDAGRLVALLEGIRARVNLIPFNGHQVSELRPPENDRVTAFQDRISKAGIRCLVRWPRGREIDAACGQLALRKGATIPSPSAPTL